MDEQNFRPPAGRRRDKTRARICAAAREVFLNSGFEAATIDEIAIAAGTRRSTIYNHFSDKNQILAAIADDYVLAVSVVIDTLPGPIPSRPQIDSWLRDFTDFVLRERVPTLLLVNFSGTQKVPPPAEAFGFRLIEAFATRLPAFAQALQPEPGIALARAVTVLRELGCALCYHMEHGGEGLSPYLLEVAAGLLQRFVEGRL
jgi:AcrR family transcriptional regulator